VYQRRRRKEDKVKRLVAPLTVVGCLLVWTGAAQAKELRSVQACGASGCTRVADPALLHRLIRVFESQREPDATATPAPARYLRIDFEMRGDGGPGPSFSHYYVPGAGVAAMETGPGQWTWIRPQPRLIRLYERVAAATKPFAAPTIDAARVNGREVADAASYALLLTIDGPQGHPNLSKSDWQQIVLSSARPNPWTSGKTFLQYSPSTNLLWRGDQFIELPAGVASAIEQARPLRLREDGSLAWVAVPAALGAAAVAGVGVVARRRRRSS
jgi:hypothetical protein